MKKIFIAAEVAGIEILSEIKKIKKAGKRCQLLNREIARLEKSWFAVGREFNGINSQSTGEIRPITSPEDCEEETVSREWNAGTESLPSWREASEWETPVQGLIEACEYAGFNNM